MNRLNLPKLVLAATMAGAFAASGAAQNDTAAQGKELLNEAKGAAVQAGDATKAAARDAKQAVVETGKDIKEGASHAAGATAATVGDTLGWSDRARMPGFTQTKDALENKLKTATTRDGYRKVLEAEGYLITAINEDSREALEYEIVKGGQTYEVQLGFDDGAARATSIDVATNIWRADATKQAMQGMTDKVVAPVYDRNAAAMARDRDRRSAFMDTKESLERQLVPGKPAQDYVNMLTSMGYMVTSVNDSDRDYVEYEIVKGKDSFEVQIDLDEKTRTASNVDVTANIWQSKETEQALDAAR
ncbi:MAG: hypothetical protein R3E68_23310 [Burkholderiaceae bacterium]